MTEIQPSRVITLFDLDLTLLSVPGNREARARALDAVTGRSDILDRVDDEGRTDRWLIDEVVRLGLADSKRLWERYEEAYIAELRRAVTDLAPCALPGAADRLTALHSMPNVTLGVATGNLRRNAVIKLEHARLDAFFSPLRGGFGDGHADRADIVREAAEACAHGEGCRLVVIGDTPHDVRSALDVGAVPIGVATGHTPAEGLREAGAHLVLPDLTDTATALRAIIG